MFWGQAVPNHKKLGKVWDMVSLLEDRIAVEHFYRKYELTRKGKRIARISYASLRDDLYGPALEYYEELQRGDLSLAERKRVSIRGRELFKRYCAVKMGSEGFDSAMLSNIMDRLVEGISLSVAKDIQTIREEYPTASDIHIEEYVTDMGKLLKFMSSTPQDFFIPVFQEVSNKLTNKHAFQINGIADTGYDMAMVDNGVSETYLTVTAFVDESCRQNPWRSYDRGLPKWQASYSYIICKGELDTEQMITADNTIEENACLARWSKNSHMATLEAIFTVLEILALKYEFRGHVKIFSDNFGVVDTWDERSVGIRLGALFDGITVTYIPRKENKKADTIGRSRIFADISRCTMKKIEKAMRGENIEEGTLDYMKSFFPEPDRDLPKLVKKE